MTERRKKLADALATLADEAKEHRETMAAAAILCALAGAMYANDDERLLEVVIAETRRMTAILQALN